ncbi:MAG: glycosyltransferase [Candidatus Pacebacteria bacterium]|nr:glycosyltransferase [Candidatus Paceibacterota bacterium]
MKLSVIIPVYNEINTLLELIKRVQKVPIEKELIIIDDGSTDGSREALLRLKEKNIRLLLNKKNRGKGFSIRRGFKKAKGEIVIIQDADLEYYPDEYPCLIEKIFEGKADVVYGTRFLGAHRVFNFYHFLGNKCLNLIANFLYNTNLSDLMTGYKAFRREVLSEINLQADRFGIEAEITAQVFSRNFRVYEVPISYDGRSYDEGKKITWKDFFRSLYWLLRGKFDRQDTGRKTLFRMSLMKNYNRWIFERIRPFLGDQLLEVGSGIGSISHLLAGLGKDVLLTDIRQDYLKDLKRRFIGHPRVAVRKHDILSDPKKLPGPIDTIICLNVLEHLEDQKAFKNFAAILKKNGRLILLVPALKCLYGSLDQKLGHLRRYRKQEIINQLAASNFEVEKIFYHNFPGALGWLVSGRVLKRKIISRFSGMVMNKMTPYLASLESRVKIPFGLSLIVVGRKK